MPQDLLHDLRKCIDELLECNAFELQMHTGENGQTDYYLPYMMNDALECYFILRDCQMTGEYAAGNSAVDLIESGNGYALIIRQPNENVATLWFKDFRKELQCYRYHEIGHFWVTGQEQWRQLVYIIGTIYDKFEYMGESICNNEELALLSLMEFAPFRYWSPIHESLDGHYPDTTDGIICFRKLCEEAGDKKLLKMVERYAKVYQRAPKFILSRAVCKLALELSKVGHESLYELIYKKVCIASSRYPTRDYGEMGNLKITTARSEISDTLISNGFVGEYPRFSKANVSILVTEEHPFTLSALEYENYEFRLQLMVSETSKEMRFLNQGFFNGNDNRGWIVKSVDELI